MIERKLSALDIVNAFDVYASACERKDWDARCDGPSMMEISAKNEAYRELCRLVAIRDDTCIPFE